jgi:CubicO group peptidase (beta-lactamase class C family)
VPLFALCLSLRPTAGFAHPPELAEVDRFLERHLEEVPIPGFSVVIVQDGRTVFQRGYGVEVAGGNAPMTERSSVGIGSLTKSFTAVAVMQLVERGLVELDEPVVTYVPWFRTADRRGREITVRMLLHNTSGLPSQDRWLYGRDRSEAAIEAGIRALSSVALVRSPGQSFEYSNENWNLLGLVVSQVSDMPYSTYLQERILRPLEMNRSTTSRTLFEPIGVLHGHFTGPAEVRPASPRFIAEALPAGSELRVSAEDMGHYLLMLLNGGVYGGTRILEEESVELLWKPGIEFRAHMPEIGATGEPAGYGMGWVVSEVDGRTIIHHGGDAIVMGSWTVLDPAAGIAASLLYNGPVLDPYRFPSKLWVVNNLLHLVLDEPLSDSGLPREADPTLNDFDLAPESFGRYAGSYVSPEGLRMGIREAAQGDPLVLEMRAGDLQYFYQLDFASESAAVLRNLSGAALVDFTMTPDGVVTGLRGGLPGGVFRKRRSEEFAGLRQVRSDDGSVAFWLPQSWDLRWEGRSFEAHDRANPTSTLVGGTEDVRWEEFVEGVRRSPAVKADTFHQRTEAVGDRQWREVLWQEGDHQNLAAMVEESGAQFRVVLTTASGVLTSEVRGVLLPLMLDLELAGP